MIGLLRLRGWSIVIRGVEVGVLSVGRGLLNERLYQQDTIVQVEKGYYVCKVWRGQVDVACLMYGRFLSRLICAEQSMGDQILDTVTIGGCTASHETRN